LPQAQATQQFAAGEGCATTAQTGVFATKLRTSHQIFKVHRREGYFASVQMKLVMYTLFF
jgi:hypothetical protein